MTFQSASLVHVYFMKGDERCLMGRLLLKDRKLFFEYDGHFIKQGLELSPFKLPLKTGVIAQDEKIFDGLFGVFNDSLPDGWGRLLLDRKLLNMGVNPGTLSPLDRLCFVGRNGMGALVYEPASDGESIFPHKDYDELASEINAFQEREDFRFVDELFVLAGSSAGARPKVMMRVENEDWLIKFRSPVDAKDVGNIEYAYHLMAQAAGLDVPDAMLFPSKKTAGYFGVKRFDRTHNERIHMHTISGLLHVDHRESALDYETIMKATWLLTRDITQCEKLFRAAVFNVLTHNRDDHAKNFSYLMDKDGKWSLSPAYDLIFSFGPSGEHATMVMGEGANPSVSHLLKLAAVGDIKKSKAAEIIDAVAHSVARWEEFAKAAGVSSASRKVVQKALHLQLPL